MKVLEVPVKRKKEKKKKKKRAFASRIVTKTTPSLFTNVSFKTPNKTNQFVNCNKMEGHS